MRRYLLLLLFFVSLLNAKDILIFNSYHATFSWTKHQNEAILEKLSHKKEYRVYIEYMDTKRNRYTDKYDNELFKFFSLKYKNKNIDLVIATDDNAIEFIKKHKKELFPKASVVFSGVSNLNVLENYPDRNITGVFEKMSPLKNYELAKKIYPNLEKLYLVGDDSITFNIKKSMFDNELKSKNIIYEYISHKNIELIEKKLKNIEQNSIAFILTPSSYIDSKGVIYSIDMALERLKKIYDKPFIAVSNVYLIGHNIIGGHTVSDINQGKLAGELALAILEKNKIEPPIYNTNKYIFDYNMLKKFNINVKKLNLKEDYLIINEPQSFYYIYKKELLLTLASIIVFFIISLVSIFYSLKLKEVNNRLDNSNKYNKKLLDSLLEGMVLIENYVCIDCNNQIVKMLNYSSKDDLIGKEIMNFIAFEDRQRVRERIETDSIQPAELTLITKEKKEIHVLTMGRNIYMNNKPLRITTFIDISEEKQKDKLLFEQSKLAAMGEMIGNISHQWRQPLSVISSAASGMKIQKEMNILNNDSFFETTDTIMKSTNYLSQTIDDFKNYIKGKKSISSLNINEPIETCLTLLKPAFINNKIFIITNIQKYPLLSNKNEIIQILINIFNNAKDALSSNENKNKMLFIETYEENKYIVISIKDNAGGVPEEIIDKIFKPYFTTKDEDKGTGLGLYMSCQLVKNSLKGDIKVSNEKYTYEGIEQFGANFKIYLPKKFES